MKRVPITGGKMVLTDDEQAIQTRHLGFTISPHEECGVEEAVRIVEADGGEVVVLTLGPAEAEEQLRECMALGADRAIHLVTAEEWDAQATAAAIVDAIRGEEPLDLIVFGNESADAGNYQVGIRVAYALGLPVVTGLKGLTVADGRARCEQEVAAGRDVYDVAAARRRHGEGGPEPAPLPVGAGEAARKSKAARREAGRRAPRRSSRSCVSSCRRVRASRRRSSGTGRRLQRRSSR